MSPTSGAGKTGSRPADAPIAVLDAAYADDASAVAAVFAASWTAAEPSEVITAPGPAAPPYESGAFYKRELPLLLAVLARRSAPLSAIVIDGHVWLDGAGAPGLGARLHAALGGSAPVVGIAKAALLRAAGTEDLGFAPIAVTRGQSSRPLFVSAVGMAREAAAAHVRAMHGDSRLPTLVKAADKAARRALPGH